MPDKRRLCAYEIARRVEARPAVWDQLWQARPIGRIAVSVLPSVQRIERVRARYDIELDDDSVPLDRCDEWWRQALLDEMIGIVARLQLPGDYCPAIAVPRFLHGQSQGMADLFGVRVEACPDGNYYPHPLPADPTFIRDLQPRAVDAGMFWRAVEWTRYARAATHGALPFRNPVMTGPLDTGCYLLGASVLLEWVRSEPDTVHGLLDKTTSVIAAMMAALRQAAGHTAHALHFSCMRGGFDLCSEVRSLVSRETYEEFEAPRLRRIGETLGPFGIHSCGNFERTIPSVLRDPNIRAMNGQVKENDLAALCGLAAGRIALSIGPSVNVHEQHTWPDMESFYRHVLATVPDNQPFEVSIPEEDLPLWKGLCREVPGAAASGVLPEPLWDIR